MGIETAAIVAGGAALAGGVASSMSAGKKTSTQTANTEPWKEQKPYLMTGFEEAQAIYDAQRRSPYFQGDTYAGLNPQMINAINSTGNFANSATNQLTTGAMQTAGAGTSAATQQTQNAAALAATGAGASQEEQAAARNLQASTANTTKTGPTPEEVQAALNLYISSGGGEGSLGGQTSREARAAMDRLASEDVTNPTEQNVAAAKRYADNPVLSEAIDAVNRDIERGSALKVAGMNREASAGGNLNSSRAGAAEAIEKRGAMDRMADNAATMRSDAYNKGLMLAEQARATGLQTNLGAIDAALKEKGINSDTQLNLLNYGLANRTLDAETSLKDKALGADTTLGLLNYGLQNRDLDARTRLNANGQLGDSAALGLDAAKTAQGLFFGGQDAALQTGAIEQLDRQSFLDQDFAKWMGEDQRAQDLLERYWNIVGGSNYGGTTVTKSTTPGQNKTAAFIQGGLGGGMAGLGAMGGLR